jgi:hypothetical protein
MQKFVKQFSAPSAWSIPNEKPDRYAAAICIRVRPDGFVARIFCWRKLPPVPAAKAETDLRRYPDCTGFRRTVISFSSWLSSSLSLPSSLSWPCSRSLEFARCKSTIDLHTYRIHHNCKIDTACFEEGKRRLATCDRTASSRGASTVHPVGSGRERSSHVVGRSRRRRSRAISWLDRPHDGSVMPKTRSHRREQGSMISRGHGMRWSDRSA